MKQPKFILHFVLQYGNTYPSTSVRQRDERELSPLLRSSFRHYPERLVKPSLLRHEPVVRGCLLLLERRRRGLLVEGVALGRVALRAVAVSGPSRRCKLLQLLLLRLRLLLVAVASLLFVHFHLSLHTPLVLVFTTTNILRRSSSFWLIDFISIVIGRRRIRRLDLNVLRPLLLM